MKKIIKNNIFGIIIGIILCTCIGVYATTTMAASEIRYATSKNANVENVDDALDALYTASASLQNGGVIKCYNGTCGKLTYKYWNDGFSNSTYQSNAMPATVYASRATLVTAYGVSNFADSPVYIRSVLIDGNVVGHEACLWYNNKEFCIAPNYWAGTLGTDDATVGENTKIKLQRDMQNALGLESANISCSSTNSYTSCQTYNFRCYSGSNGFVRCRSSVTSKYCGVTTNGSVGCYVE